MNQQTTLCVASLLGGVSVALGAFGAHALKPTLVALDSVGTFELASRYQFYHALALLATGILMIYLPESTLLKYASWCFVIGAILFSGSLYLLSLYKWRFLGPVTPIGGLFLIAGWIFLFIQSLKFTAKA